MLHLKPVQPKNASEKVGLVYQDIQNVFGIETVPLLFQYLANYEEYFVFLWERMKKNIKQQSFKDSCREIKKFAAQTIEGIFSPSRSILDFIKHLHSLDKKQIQGTVSLLEETNTILLLLLIDLRESMKSIFIGTERISQYSSEMRKENFSDFTQEEMGLSVKSSQNTKVSEASKMLAPLFGTNTLIISHYPDFFAHVSSETERLKNTENYLKSRVELEHLSLLYISKFVEPLGISYLEFLKLTHEKPHINELLYLITDSFPSQFPHLVFATALMKIVLEKIT